MLTRIMFDGLLRQTLLEWMRHHSAIATLGHSIRHHANLAFTSGNLAVSSQDASVQAGGIEIVRHDKNRTER